MSDQAAQTAFQDGLADRLLKGDPRALARAITELQNETPSSSALLVAIQPHCVFR